MLRRFVITISIITVLLSANWGQAVEGKKLDKDLTEAGFLHLFNGRDLTGWDGDPNFWSVKDGIIVAQVSPAVPVKNHSYLIWLGEKVKDFELRLKLRSSVGNSGIDYRAEHVPEDRDGRPLKWTIQGYQSDIAKGWMGSLYNWGKPGAQPSQFVVVSGGENITKSVGSVVDKDFLYKSGYYYKPQRWNEYSVIARGSHILHRINGLPVVEFIDNSPDARRKGLLGLQVHSGRGPFLNEFKDIRISKCKYDFGRPVLLFNGQDMNDWTFSSYENKNKWSVENNLLVNRPGSQGRPIHYICTEDDYTNYVLRFQYRRQGNKETAVLLRFADSPGANPKGIRIYGTGSDFIWVRSVGGFAPEMHERVTSRVGRPMPPDFWNECEIKLNNSKLEIRINAVLRALVTGCSLTPGKIAFETGQGQAQYRNIVLIPILSGKGG